MKNKKGFTIVELVIVIAVIAILAAVLIPTFSNIIKKANISSDTQLVRNLNTALSTDSAINGAHKTMYAALEAAKEAGYDVTKINASATGNEILWDSVADAFCYLNNNKIEYTPDVTGDKADEAKTWLFWQIADEMPADAKYSIYAGNNWATATVDANGIGFDAGTSTAITAVNYTNATSDAKEVVIRTNGGNLTVNAPEDTVKHYGEVVKLHIKAIANSSWHEFGYVNFAQVDSGRFVVENDANVGVAYVESSTATLEGTVAIKLTEADITAFTKSGDVVTLTYKAYVGNKGYDKVQDAVNDATNGQTVVLLTDTWENLVIPETSNLVLDLGGHKLTASLEAGKSGVLNNGKIKISNGTITHEGNGKYLIENAQNSEVILENLTVIGNADSSMIANNGGTLTINSGYYVKTSGKSPCLKNDAGTTTINGGKFEKQGNDGKKWMNNWQTMIINGGEFYGDMLTGASDTENSITTINGGYFECSYIQTYLDSDKNRQIAKTIVNNGIFAGTVKLDANHQVEIKGGTIKTEQ